MASQIRNLSAVCLSSAMIAFLTVVPAACDWARDAAGTVAEIESRYPGSRVEIDDRTEAGARNVAVTITGPGLDAGGEIDLAGRAREVAVLVRRHYGLAAETDTVVVAFRSESGTGVVTTRQSARFVYPVTELGSD